MGGARVSRQAVSIQRRTWGHDIHRRVEPPRPRGLQSDRRCDTRRPDCGTPRGRPPARVLSQHVGPPNIHPFAPRDPWKRGLTPRQGEPSGTVQRSRLLDAPARSSAVAPPLWQNETRPREPPLCGVRRPSRAKELTRRTHLPARLGRAQIGEHLRTFDCREPIVGHALWRGLTTVWSCGFNQHALGCQAVRWIRLNAPAKRSLSSMAWRDSASTPFGTRQAVFEYRCARREGAGC